MTVKHEPVLQSKVVAGLTLWSGHCTCGYKTSWTGQGEAWTALYDHLKQVKASVFRSKPR